MWDAFVELIRLTILTTAHVCAGSLGAGIIGVSAAVRLALLPLTLHLARQAREQQMRIAALRPALDALRQQHAKGPVRLMQETRALYAKHGIRMITPVGFVGLLIQLPLLSGLFSAVRAGLGARVRFLWIADLARPNSTLLLIVMLLTGSAALLAPKPVSATGTPSIVPLVLISVGGTLAFLWTASSAVALSVGAGSMVSALQSWLLARDVRRESARNAG
jgi:YidC/Oxa1 family membrane protein insertase